MCCTVCVFVRKRESQREMEAVEEIITIKQTITFQFDTQCCYALFAVIENSKMNFTNYDQKHLFIGSIPTNVFNQVSIYVENTPGTQTWIQPDGNSGPSSHFIPQMKFLILS